MKQTLLLVTFLLGISLSGFAGEHEKGKSLNLVFIGNSITQGAIIKNPEQDAPPAKTAAWMRTQPGIESVQFANCGVSGCTTLDYLPAVNTLFPKAVAAADRLKAASKAQLLFSVMLGTNDSAVKGPYGSPVLPKQYQTNLKVIIDRLLALYPDCRVVVHRPLWYSPNTYNSAMYLQEGLTRLENYLPEIEILVADYAVSNPGRVWMGDRDGFDYFKANHLTDAFAEQGNAGTFYLHPNEKGATRLAEFWGAAILRALK